MKTRRGKWLALCCCFLMIAHSTIAKHIFGGDFTMLASRTQNGWFNLSLNLFFDQNLVNLESFEQSVNVTIFRKSDNRRITQVQLPLTTTTPIAYDNVACAELRKLKTSEVKFSAEFFLDPATYNHPQGYYIIWERCCRSNDIDNIRSPEATGMVFTLDFPPMLVNAAPFRNSSPDFSIPNGDYICVNKPFTFDMGARDNDGDELRYSLVAPLAGYTSASPFQALGTGQSYSSYPEVRWLPGFTPSTAISGPRPMVINARTGLITLTANRVGLYVFAVLVEEYRAGVRIGSVRREFQLPVVECTKTTPPLPVISTDINTKLGGQTIEICTATPLRLAVPLNENWNYQWQKNGDNIPNATAHFINIDQVGDYNAVVSFAKTCANDTVSGVVKVVLGKSPVAKLTPADTLRFCDGDSAQLTATMSSRFQYQWFFDNTEIKNQTSNVLRVKQSGTYEVVVRETGVTCPARDTVRTFLNPKPNPRFSFGTPVICPTDSVRLQVLEPLPNEGVEWYFNDVVLISAKNQIFARRPGEYQGIVRNAQNCVARSEKISIKNLPTPDIVIDSIPPICVNDSLPRRLVATPANGVFVVKSLTNGTFFAPVAGVGAHKVSYIARNAEGCANIGQSEILVKAAPLVTLPTRISVLRGDTVAIKADIDQPNSRFLWSPPLFLNSATVLRPLATPTASTTYKLTATAPNGCISSASVRVFVFEKIFVPEVFTPNNDGLNDTFEIKNLKNYPNCETFVYNRWGEVIFQNKGNTVAWDGTFRGERVPAGAYIYFVRTNGAEESVVYRGNILVLY